MSLSVLECPCKSLSVLARLMKPGTDVVAILCVNVLFDLQANHTKGTTIRCGVSRAPGATAQPLLMSRCVHGNERV